MRCKSPRKILHMLTSLIDQQTRGCYACQMRKRHKLFVIPTGLPQWWKDRRRKYRDRATEKMIAHLEELADEHERGVRDRSKRLRRLLTRFHRDAGEPELYELRLDNIRRILGHRETVESKIRQAIKLKWKKTTEVTKDEAGLPFTRRCVRFARGKEEAVLWYKDAKVTLVRLNLPFKFDDFIELKKFIAEYPRNPDLDDVTGEVKYRREIELFFVRHGHQDDLMHIQATDNEFFIAFQKLIEAGYAARKASVVVAGLVLQAVQQFYKQDRERAIRWLAKTTDDLNRDQLG
jgi:hypothetical protein